MSHLVCPLCGKNAPLNSFHPESLELDISLVNYKGVISERGFEIPQRYSVIGDDYITPKVVSRVIELCNFFISNGVITSDEISNRLGLKEDSVNPAEVSRLVDENYRLKLQLIETQRQLQNFRVPTEKVPSRSRATNINPSLGVKSNNVEIDKKESRTAEIEGELEDIVEMITTHLEYVRSRRAKRMKNWFETNETA